MAEVLEYEKFQAKQDLLPQAVDQDFELAAKQIEKQNAVPYQVQNRKLERRLEIEPKSEEKQPEILTVIEIQK